MILMPVGYKHSSYSVNILFKIREIGYNQVYTEHILLRESKAAIDNYHVRAVFVNGYVFAYLVESAEEGDFYRCGGCLL